MIVNKLTVKLTKYDQLNRCWRRGVGDGFGNFGHKHSLPFYISLEYRHSKNVDNIEFQSPTSTNRNIHKSHFHGIIPHFSRYYTALSFEDILGTRSISFGVALNAKHL